MLRTHERKNGLIYKYFDITSYFFYFLFFIIIFFLIEYWKYFKQSFLDVDNANCRNDFAVREITPLLHLSFYRDSHQIQWRIILQSFLDKSARARATEI